MPKNAETHQAIRIKGELVEQARVIAAEMMIKDPSKNVSVADVIEMAARDYFKKANKKRE